MGLGMSLCPGEDPRLQEWGGNRQRHPRRQGRCLEQETLMQPPVCRARHVPKGGPDICSHARVGARGAALASKGEADL